MDTSDPWLTEVGGALGLDPVALAAIDVAAVLDLTRDVAHGVARPAAPVTAFLVGLAAGRAGGEAAHVREAIAAVLDTLARR